MQELIMTFPSLVVNYDIPRQSIGENIQDKNDSLISELLLSGVSSNNNASNTCNLNATIITDSPLEGLTSLLLTLDRFERFTFLNTYVNTTVLVNSSNEI